jgi:hypothetical protein
MTSQERADMLSLLMDARKLIAQPHQWIQYAWAQNADNHSCSVQNPRACKFCLVGAVIRAAFLRPKLKHIKSQVLQAITMELPEPHTRAPLFNDSFNTTHAGVLAVLDATIASVEGETL